MKSIFVRDLTEERDNPTFDVVYEGNPGEWFYSDDVYYTEEEAINAARMLRAENSFPDWWDKTAHLSGDGVRVICEA